MIEIAILRAMLEWRIDRVGGATYKLSHLHRQWAVPKTTFYRAVKTLMDFGILVRASRDNYYLSTEWVSLCTLAVAEDV